MAARCLQEFRDDVVGAPRKLRIAIITWIERTERRRRQTRLARLSPIDDETIMNPTVSLAASPQLPLGRALVPVNFAVNDTVCCETPFGVTGLALTIIWIATAMISGSPQRMQWALMAGVSMCLVFLTTFWVSTQPSAKE